MCNTAGHVCVAAVEGQCMVIVLMWFGQAGKPNPASSAVSDTAQVWSAAVAANQNPCGPIDMHKIAKAWQQGWSPSIGYIEC